ncbi:MAG: hypothetical protein NPMRTH1_350014 [Nitrosopumilales archaeon]|nr:MAG: hypothetical protein NPMRTH1_350014 [Nitrosopumilales archaeon]
MEIPDLNCQIDVYCSINPSEDPSKVKQAVSNVLPDMEIQADDTSLKASSQNLESLSNIYETIHSHRSQRAYRRFMKKNLRENTTWFYLNKQAALADSVVLCDEADESPLGPIKIILTSNAIEEIIDWLAS